MSDQNVEIVRAALEAFRRGDVDTALEHIHPDMVSKRTDPRAFEEAGLSGS